MLSVASAINRWEWLSLFTSGDRVLIVVLMAAIGATLRMGMGSDPGTRIAVRSGAESRVYDLGQPAVWQVYGPIGESEIAIGPAGARIQASPCLHQHCVHRGWVHRQGDSVVCIPNEVVLVVLGGQTGIDAVVR